ncbi:MAG: hypothetical protein O2840_00775 [bacterium]|nr:hypothetical protein [bacterium]
MLEINVGIPFWNYFPTAFFFVNGAIFLAIELVYLFLLLRVQVEAQKHSDIILSKFEKVLPILIWPFFACLVFFLAETFDIRDLKLLFLIGYISVFFTHITIRYKAKQLKILLLAGILIVSSELVYWSIRLATFPECRTSYDVPILSGQHSVECKTAPRFNRKTMELVVEQVASLRQLLYPAIVCFALTFPLKKAKKKMVANNPI